VSLYGIDPKQDWGFSMMLKNGATPDKCVACGACEAACPQHLPIIESLQKAWKELYD
jgi:predicted aldo/keto reductase-like oxidoreductase